MRINLPLQLREASMMPATVDEKERTIEVCWSTGASVRRGGFFSEPYNEVLDMSPQSIRMGRLQSGNAPVLDSHNSWSLGGVMGNVVSASVDGGEGRAKLRFITGDPDVDRAWNKIQQGACRNCSVGYRVHKAVEEGRDADGARIFRVVDWEPYEISMVPVPADAGAHARAGEETNSCELVSQEAQPASRPGPGVSMLRLLIELEGESL